MGKTHEMKIRVARDAIDGLFSDTSVGPEETLSALEDLAADVDSKIDALKGDIG
jgi:hypothetical protein